MTDETPALQPRRVTRRQRGKRLSRWWLAGLLVGCLLPTSLVHADAVRIAEQLTQICLLAPADIRAESRRVAKRKARRILPLRWRFPARLGDIRTRDGRRPCAGLDVLNRRGPPWRLG